MAVRSITLPWCLLKNTVVSSQLYTKNQRISLDPIVQHTQLFFFLNHFLKNATKVVRKTQFTNCRKSKIKNFSNFFHQNYDNLQQKKSLLKSASIFDMTIIRTMQRVRELETSEL
jgi:hypothetical protein